MSKAEKIDPIEPYVQRNMDGKTSIFYDLAEGKIVTQAQASVMRRTDYTSQTWDTDAGAWQVEGIPGSAQEKISKAVKYFIKDPVVNRCVSLLAELANDSFRISSEDKDEENFVRTWWKDVGGDVFLEWFFLEYYRSGTVPVFKTLIPYVPKDYVNKNATSASVENESVSAYKDYHQCLDDSAVAERAYEKGNISRHYRDKSRKALAAAIVTWQIKSIPGAYTILDPLSIDISGPEGMEWAQMTYLRLSDDIKKSLSAPAKEIKDVVSCIPKEVLSEIKKGSDKVYLPPYLCTVVSRLKQPYEKWASPIMTSAFESLDFKYELREMDRHTVRSVRNRILKVTIGSDQFPCFDPAQIKQLAQEFNNPSRNMTIFWNHTLNIEFVEPNLDSLAIDKYEPVLEDIRSAFGVTKIFTGNSGDSMGNNVLNMKGLAELVSEGQNSFLNFFRNELKRMQLAVKLKFLPEAGFGKLNMKDENDYIRVLSGLVDRQVISYQTMVETIGHHFPKELDRLKKEKAIRDSEGILMPQVAPTQAGVDAGGGGATKNAGRPAGVKEPVKRTSRIGKPKTPNGANM